MKPMLLALAALALVACKDSSARPQPSALVGKLATLADAGCACSDKACADKVRADVAELAKGAGAIADADLPALQAAQARLDGCLVHHEPRYVAYKALTDEVCACKDAACAKKVAGEFAAWSADLKKTGAKLDRADAQQIMEVGKEAARCLSTHGVAIPK